ncbi:methionine--tRNA ligase [Candidatus Saccharibacteria bacterium]|nr:methionine--tRNA ligase [Candidatus Saccharibacteria bacterium]
MEKVYLTTAIPYVNGAPHIGHAMDYCLADVFARYNRMIGNEVRFQAGTDEHGNKIFQKAKELGIPTTEYVKKNSEKFQEFIKKLNVTNTDFIRTTDTEHEKRVQEIWKKLEPHIYKSEYTGWYCNGCERYVTDKEYEENGGVCPDHQKPYEKLSEENYYFRIADFKQEIIDAITSGKMLILPDYREKEVLKLIQDSPDVSISRPVSQLTWGVPVPDDESQVMYVWIDALSNYITVLGYPDKDISEWWPATAQFVGKDILRFHAIIWPAMLIGLGLPLPKTITTHGFILANGQKMSKSIGNVVEPMEVIEKHGVDAFRYFFLRHIDTFADSDFTWEKFENAYNNELANDLGNLVQRVATLIHKNVPSLRIEADSGLAQEYCELMNGYEFSKAMDYAWEKVQAINKKLDDEKPWMMAKAGETEKLTHCLTEIARDILNVNTMLAPFIPGTAEKISAIFDGEIMPPDSPLFPKER